MIQYPDIATLYELYKQHPNVQTDTRKLAVGAMYFALKGANFNGNAFALQALEQGAAYAVIDEEVYGTHPRCVLVADAQATLQELAAYHRSQFTCPIIAITGSNGKTTTKELTTAVLATHKRVHATRGNLNNHVGIPLTLLQMPADTEVGVIEMGANHQKEIEGYCKIVKPTHALITNCGKAHIEGFGGEEGVRKGKGELYDYIRAHGGTIFRNQTLPYLEQMSAGIAHQITYGYTNATYCGNIIENSLFLAIKIDNIAGLNTIETQLIGDYNYGNVMSAVAVGMHLGIPAGSIAQAIAGYKPDNNRSEWQQTGTNRLILDAYNANPNSMEAAIKNFAGLPLPNKMLWIGGMKEMGEDEVKEHKALVQLIAGYAWQQVILVGKEFEGLQGGYLWFPGSEQAAAYIAQNMPQNASILIKGSRGSKMEAMADVLKR